MSSAPRGGEHGMGLRARREGEHVVEMQRRRLLTATVEVVFERGAQGVSVATVCERAGISRRTFYEIFDGREECLYATFEDAVAQAEAVVTRAVAARAGETMELGTGRGQGVSRPLAWRERVAVGLGALLSFLDYEPGLARLLIVDALASGEQTLQARKCMLARAIAIVDEGRGEARAGREPPALTAEGIVGAVFAVIHARVLESTRVGAGPHAGIGDLRPLAELSGALMALVVAPYLGPAAAERELKRPLSAPKLAPRLPSDPFKDLPIRLTYRTARVLSSIATAPGASNKQVAQASGISDPGQISRLLTRLQRHELIRDTGIGPAKGMARAWSLTPRGEGVLQSVGEG